MLQVFLTKHMRLMHCSLIQCHSTTECLMAFCPHRSFTRVTFYNSIYFQKIQSYKISIDIISYSIITFD